MDLPSDDAALLQPCARQSGARLLDLLRRAGHGDCCRDHRRQVAQGLLAPGAETLAGRRRGLEPPQVLAAVQQRYDGGAGPGSPQV